MNLYKANNKAEHCITYSFPEDTSIIPFPYEILNGPPEGSNKVKIWVDESCKYFNLFI